MAFKCFDDPKAILDKDFCVSALSKNIKGSRKHVKRIDKKCQKPECKTYRIVHKMQVSVLNSQCDSPASKPITGTLMAELVTAYDTDGNHRGFHSGTFQLVNAGGLNVKGTMSGVTNEGSHRLPIKACQKCDDRGIMEGKLCGEVVKAGDSDLKGCQVIAAYRFKFDPSVKDTGAMLVGVIEGVLVCFCKA